jgi:hypothetical protein
MKPLRFIFGLIALCVAFEASALKVTAPNGADIGGRWTVNAQLSDDGEALLAERMEEIREEQRRFEERRRRQMRNDPFAWEPEFAPPERTPQNIARMEERERDRRQTLGMTKYFDITQSEQGTKLTIESEFETRRLEAGSRSQVSLPQGQLADLTAGWDGEWFVIERRSRGGPRITESFRRLTKTDQLEMRVKIGGDSMLSGIKLRRVFDRAQADAQVRPSGEIVGPVR